MKKVVIANWKMNPQTGEQARALFASVEHRLHTISDKTETVVCPPYVFLPMLAHHTHMAKLGAQNMNSNDQGPHTGEISPQQLVALKVSHVVIGHSERRIYHHETDKDIKAKINAAIEHKLTPVVCLGGSEKADKEKMKPLVTKQFNAAIKDLSPVQISKIIFVYEPTWAISSMDSSTPATGEHASELVDHIRQLLIKHVGEDKTRNMPVLYGGTVNKHNVMEYAKYPQISGALVGFASLNADNFLSVVKEFNREAVHKL